MRRSIAFGTLGVAVIVGIPVYGGYREDLVAARRASLAGSTLIATRCGDIEYAERGKGPAVLAIHGTGGGWDQGLFLARGLVDRGFRVIAPSRYGYLRTPMPSQPSPQREADFLACLLDTLGVERVSVIAASAGATPALQLALRHPHRVSSLVLLVPAIGGISPPETTSLVSPFIMNVVLGSDFPYWAAMKAYPRAALTVVAVPHTLVPTLASDARATLDQAIRMIMPVTRRRRGILYDAGNQQHEQPYPLKDVSVPTLLVSADDDLYKTLANARVAAATIPHARLVRFPTGGHLLLGNDAALWPLVADFIAWR